MTTVLILYFLSILRKSLWMNSAVIMNGRIERNKEGNNKEVRTGKENMKDNCKERRGN